MEKSTTAQNANILDGTYTDESCEQARARQLRRAFTIIELLAVLTIIAALAGLGIPRFQDIVQSANVARTIGEMHMIQNELAAQDSLPDDLEGIGRAGMLDPWGYPYVYYKFPASNHHPTGARKDRFLVPVNSTYDLYSIGADGKTSLPFTAHNSQDDVVRASDGDYIGLASKF